MTRDSQKALVAAAINGDVESFNELAKQYYPTMVAIAHSILGRRDLAEDAAQQTFARTAVKLPQLKQLDKFPAWLAAICRNQAKNITRAENRRRIVSEVSYLETKSDEDDYSDVVKVAIGKLSASNREVIYLRYYDGFSYEQISDVLGISPQAINGRLRRAKKRIAELLKREGIGQV